MDSTANLAVKGSVLHAHSTHEVPPSLSIAAPGALGRESLEAYIGQVFRLAYRAKVQQFMPLLVGLVQDAQPWSALGLRAASSERLFCEQYLDEPVECLVERLYGDDRGRGGIMELGNLVASRPGHSATLYLLTVAALAEAGTDYLLFAANRAVRRSIERCRFTPVVVCPAEAQRISEPAQWGSYYRSDPRVMLANIPLTLQQALVQPRLRALLEQHAPDIEQLAGALGTLQCNA